MKITYGRRILFADSDTKLAYTTKVVGEIKTPSDTLTSLKQEVERQIIETLKDGITRPSRSPYNAPIWVVV